MSIVVTVLVVCLAGTCGLYVAQQVVTGVVAERVMETVSSDSPRKEPHFSSFGKVPEQDKQFWIEYAQNLRCGFLERTNENAEKWRNVFGGMLAVFGALVIVGGPGAFQDLDRHQALMFVIVMVSLTLALNAVFYAGLAANGMPKMWINLGDSPEAVRSHVYRRASNSLVRLYVAFGCGLLSLVGVVIGVGVGLASASDL